MKTIWTILKAFGILVAILFVMAMFQINNPDPNVDKKAFVAELREAAHECVLAHLKAPRTAQWVGDDGYKELKNGVFYVAGHVDAQNGFGALIRSKYQVWLKREDGRYKLTNIQMQ